MKNIEDLECPYCNEFNKINLDNFNINEFREIKCNHCDGEVIIKIYIDPVDEFDNIFKKRFYITYQESQESI